MPGQSPLFPLQRENDQHLLFLTGPLANVVGGLFRFRR